jgi:hypothetical protein
VERVCHLVNNGCNGRPARGGSGRKCLLERITRHIPTDGDCNKSTAWERTVGDWALNRYQNGAYWGRRTGWVGRAIAPNDDRVAVEMAAEIFEELKAAGFRKGDPFGSPHGCMHPADEYRRNPISLTSVTVPLTAFMRLG